MPPILDVRWSAKSTKGLRAGIGFRVYFLRCRGFNVLTRKKDYKEVAAAPQRPSRKERLRRLHGHTRRGVSHAGTQAQSPKCDGLGSGALKQTISPAKP